MLYVVYIWYFKINSTEKTIFHYMWTICLKVLLAIKFCGTLKGKKKNKLWLRNAQIDLKLIYDFNWGFWFLLQFDSFKNTNPYLMSNFFPYQYLHASFMNKLFCKLYTDNCHS